MTEATSIRINPEEYVEEQGEVFDPADGPYEAVLTGFATFSGEYGPGIVWRFEIADEDGTTAEAAGFSSQSMAAGDRPSKLIKWARVFFGGEIPEGGVDLSELEGKSCRVDIDTYIKNDITKMKVIDVKAPRKGKAKRSMTEAG